MASQCFSAPALRSYAAEFISTFLFFFAAMGSTISARMLTPARSFGPAVISGNFKNQGVYWVGPLFGAALAALVHQYLVYPSAGPNSSETRHSVMEAVVV